MFFILSKILFFLLSPGLWIAALLTFAYIKRRRTYAKPLVWSSAVLFLFFSNEFLFKKCMYAWQVNKTTMQHGVKYTSILLAGFMHFDKDRNPSFNYHADRFIQTLKLYNTGAIDRIIITGGSGSLSRPELNEATAAKKEFLLNKIPDSVIYTESLSRNTSENARFTKKLIDSLKIPGPYLLITSASHMRRAQAVFQHEKISTAAYPAIFEASDDPFEWDDLIPKIYILQGWEGLLREIVGLNVYKITGRA